MAIEITYDHTQWGATRNYRDVWDAESRELSRYLWVKTRKCWKPMFKFRIDGTSISVSSIGRETPLWKDYGGETWFENSEVDEACLTALQEEIPAAKYWIKKLMDIEYLDFLYLAKLMEFRDIPETESLIMVVDNIHGNYNRLGLQIITNTAWRRLKTPQRKQVINYLRTCQRGIPYSIKECLARENPYHELLIGYGNHQITMEDIKWLERHPVKGLELRDAVSEFHDYLQEQENLVPDITDPYWRHRKDWRKIHQKEQKRRHWHRRVNGLRVFLDLPEKSYEKVDTKIFKQRYAPLTSMTMQEGDLKAYFSDNIKEWEKHATSLRQCLMSCHYYNRSECRILFFTRNGVPEATAEIRKGNKVGQFMGDERNSMTIMPKDDVKELLKKFVATYSII